MLSNNLFEFMGWMWLHKLMLETKFFCGNQPCMCIFQKICTTWNKLPYTVCMEKNFETFKQQLKTYLFKLAFDV